MQIWQKKKNSFFELKQFNNFYCIITMRIWGKIITFFVMKLLILLFKAFYYYRSFPVAQMVEHGTSNTKIMGSIPRESKSW